MAILDFLFGNAAWIALGSMIFACMWAVHPRKSNDPKQAPQQEKIKMGDYFKFFHCDDCLYSVHDREIKKMECCPKCGNDDVNRVVGRWEYELKVHPYYKDLSDYQAVKFHPKEG